VIAASCHPVIQGRTPPLVGHPHRAGESLLCTSACLGFLLCHDASFFLSPSHTVTIELQGQLLARERELDSREGAMVMWEEGLAALACTLGEERTECDVCCVCADAIQWDFFAQACASSSMSK
jgi:hypothetical protein